MCEMLSIQQHLAWLDEARFSIIVMLSVVERLLREAQAGRAVSSMAASTESARKTTIAVILYVHRLSYNLKKIGLRGKVKVFSALNG